MKEYFKEKVTLPIEIGSTILFGKFKNKKAVVKSFGKDKNNQPVIISDTGKEIPLLKIRIPSLMPETYQRLFKESYDYHCLLLPITSDYVKSNIKFLQRKIKLEDIFNDDSNEYGLELSPHITVLYGLKNEDDYGKLKDYFKNKPQIKFTIGEISLFESPDKPYDVLKFEIISNDLVKYNSYVRENFDCDITFPDYKPHMTIAYLVKGKGKNYLKFDSDLTEETFRENHLEFCFANGNKSRIQLGR